MSRMSLIILMKMITNEHQDGFFLLVTFTCSRPLISAKKSEHFCTTLRIFQRWAWWWHAYWPLAMDFCLDRCEPETLGFFIFSVTISFWTRITSRGNSCRRQGQGWLSDKTSLKGKIFFLRSLKLRNKAGVRFIV